MTPIDREKAERYSPRRDYRRRMKEGLPWPPFDAAPTQSMEPTDPAAVPHAHMDEHG